MTQAALALPQLTVEQELQALGYGHRRNANTDTTGQHTLFRLDTGEAIGTADAHTAVTLARFDKAARAIFTKPTKPTQGHLL